MILANTDTRYPALRGGCPQSSDVSAELYRPQRHRQPQVAQQADRLHEAQRALGAEGSAKIDAKDLYLAEEDHGYRAKAIAQEYTGSVSISSLAVRSCIYSRSIGANRGVRFLHLPNGRSRSLLSGGSGPDQMPSGSGAWMRPRVLIGFGESDGVVCANHIS